ncbi:MAG: phosphopantetheine-binding protein [Nitrospinales bacterium]
MEKIRNFISLTLMDGQNVGENDLLIEDGLLDSIGIVQLVAFLEEEFDIEIDEEDFNEDNLGTVGKIAQFLEKKSAGKSN